MIYNKSEEFSISNSEARLLETLAVEGELSGYQMISCIEGFAAGEPLGSTSVYTGLKSLEEKGCLTARIDTSKRGKGPLPKKYRITEQGMEAAKSRVFDDLVEGTLQDGRFDLALSGMALLGKEAVLQALRRRRMNLEGRLDGIKERFVARGGGDLPLHQEELFRHSMVLLETERRFVAELIDRVKRTMR